MSVILKFSIKKFGNVEKETVIHEECTLESLFSDVLKSILNKYLKNISLDKIAVITRENEILNYKQIRKKITEIISIYLTSFTITSRSQVDGPNLLVDEEIIKKPRKYKMDKTRSLPSEQTEELKEEFSESKDEILQEEEIKARKSMELDEDLILSAIDKITSPKTPPSAPKSVKPPPTPEPTSEPTSEPSPEPTSEPTPEAPLEPTAESKSIPPLPMEENKIEDKPPKIKYESMDIKKSFSKSKEKIPISPLTKKSKKKESKQIFKKNIAVEYFEVMNPEKVYPLIIDISEIKQKFKATQENILTGERKTQKREKMEVLLESSLITVRPIFPGCNIVSTELHTDFKNKQDKLKFYITPLVNDKLEEARIQFLNYKNVIIHTIETPSKVVDPRYARTVAMYGSLASVLPKIFLFFGIDFGNDININEILPIFTNIIGNMTLSNFIGVFGIGIALIISSAIYFSRKPRSTKKEYTISDLRKLIK